MDTFTRLTAIAAPLRWANVNTDDIFPAPGASPWVKLGRAREVMNDRTKMGPNAFAARRWLDNGDPDPRFVLNQSPFNKAGILIARENFGCGSSREMAVWCLLGIGVRCVIAPSFGDIFYNNCFKNGMLPVRLPSDDVEYLLTLAETHPAPLCTVDLEQCVVTDPDGRRYPFEVGDYQRNAMLNGLDEIAATLERLPAIEAHESAYLARRPWLRGPA